MHKKPLHKIVKKPKRKEECIFLFFMVKYKW
jgi:hypothetical protein